MNNETLFDAMGGIRDEYIASAAVLLDSAKEEYPMKELNDPRRRRLGKTILIAAAAACLLTTAVFAAVFAFSHRVPAADETFRFHWTDSENGYLEWTNAKLAVTYPETAESRAVEFRPGWLPYELPEEMLFCEPSGPLTGDTWFSRFSSESLCWDTNVESYPEYAGLMQPLQINTYAMSQFNEGGAMLMLYQTPGEIAEEHWDEQGVDVLRFQGTQHFDARPEFDMPERTIEYNYVLLANADEGWVAVICGQLDMDTMVRVARSLEFRPTGKTLTYRDFEDHYLFFDGGVG